MKNFTAEELQANYFKLVGYIDLYITGERKEKLRKLYEDHAERIMFMPASGNENYHNCFTGGYVDHVIRVIDAAIDVANLWKGYGASDCFIISAMTSILAYVQTYLTYSTKLINWLLVLSMKLGLHNNHH